MGVKKITKTIKKTTKDVINDASDFIEDTGNYLGDQFNRLDFIDRLKRMIKSIKIFFETIVEGIVSLTDIFVKIGEKTKLFINFITKLDSVLLSFMNGIFVGFTTVIFEIISLMGKIVHLFIKKTKLFEIIGYLASILFVIYSLSITMIFFIIFSLFMSRGRALMAAFLIIFPLSMITFYFLSNHILGKIDYIIKKVSEDNVLIGELKKIISEVEDEIKKLFV